MKVGSHLQANGDCQFTVWAPSKERVTLKIIHPREEEIPMEENEEGYWTITLPNITSDTRYFYHLDDELRPDPASYYQPDGVHGPSQVIDHTFEWSDRNWEGVSLESLIIYELHVGTFTPEGTFEAIIPRLQDLKNLGVNAIELMPIAQFPGDSAATHHKYRNWGYDGAYLFAVQNSYGGPNGLKRLVDACHRVGIAVILDVVYNHFGPEGNYMSHFGPYFTKAYCTPWGNAINFDGAHSYPVRQFFLQNMMTWLQDYHIDGLRLDAVQAIYDLGAKHILQEMAEVAAEYSAQQNRHYFLIAESDLNDVRIIRPKELSGHGLDAQWADDFHHALYALLTGENCGYYQDYGKCEHLVKAFQDSFVYDWKYAPHRYRFHGAPARDRPPTQFVVCIQNHDQVGNALPGDRLSKRTSYEGLKLAAGAVILSPYIPMLFMGEEYGEDVPFTYFVSHSDPALIKAVREGRKREFEAFHLDMEPPDPEAIETFMVCQLQWEKRLEGKHQVLWSFYQHLIRLRQTLPALLKRDRNYMEATCNETDKLVCWRRWCDDEQLLCLMNFNAQEIQFQPALLNYHWSKVLDSAEEKWMGPGAIAPEELTPMQTISLPPHSFVLYRATEPSR